MCACADKREGGRAQEREGGRQSLGAAEHTAHTGAPSSPSSRLCLALRHLGIPFKLYFSKHGVPSAPFFEDLLERSENVSRLKAEYGAKSTIDLMIYPKEFFDFEASFTLSPAAISLARQTDSELWLDIS